ncbi:MAG: hypothetical protein JSW50_08085 [Candidatus Latescibacterota bacterium]|nr:MAG: hypothetical protein JSW50_08085 [Candidatus Latescibacterota bacterium]
MKAFVKSVLLFPAGLGLVIGSLEYTLGGWRHTDALVWALSLGLCIGVWFPFLLVPYLRRFSDRSVPDR